MFLSRLSGTSLKRASALGLVLFGGAALLGACSSSNNSSNTTTSSTATSTSSPGSSSTASSTAASGATGATGATSTSSAGATGGTGSAGGGAAALKAIADKLKTGETQAFVATYKVTGSSQVSTIQVAAQPPSSFAFVVSESSGNKTNLFGNSSSATACTQASGSSTWSCFTLPQAALGSYSSIVDLYTGKFWATELSAFEAEAAAKGATVSTMTVGGQSAQCVTFGTHSGGTVCVTDSGVLAYVKNNGTGSTFELQSISSSPPASLFQPPPGATNAGSLP
jgi:hypothetical protein